LVLVELLLVVVVVEGVDMLFQPHVHLDAKDFPRLRIKEEEEAVAERKHLLLYVNTPVDMAVLE
jgi:hypothetical protein